MRDQIDGGITVDFVFNTRIGDLAFFTGEGDGVSHVGIILDHQKIIHVCGAVRIDHIDHYGIYDEEAQRYTHRLRIIKRYFYDESLS